MKQRLDGLGLGLREAHAIEILKQAPEISWFECLLDNWIEAGIGMRNILLAIAERYPLAMHGVGLSIASAEPIDFDYLRKVKQLIKDTGSLSYSEHCSFSGLNGKQFPDLYPFPYTRESLQLVADKVEQVQDFLQRPLILENISAYIQPAKQDLSEAKFFQQLSKKTGCKVLLDVNNCYVNAINAQSDPANSLAEYAQLDIVQLHLAGYSAQKGVLIDTHGGPVSNEVIELWQLLPESVKAKPVLLEWDNHLPSFDKLYQSYQQLKNQLFGACVSA